MHCTLWWMATFLAAIVLVSGAAAGEPYRDAARHFSLMLPDGWQVMPAEEIEQLNQVFEALAPGEKLKYDTGFRPRVSEPFTPPYVLVQVIPGRVFGATPDEVRQGLDRKFRELSMATGPLNYHEKVDSVTSLFRSFAPDGRPVRGIADFRLGSEITVLLTWHSEEDLAQAERDLKPHDQMCKSFRFDDGYSFTPSPGPLGALKEYTSRTEVLIVVPLLCLVAIIVIKSARTALRPVY